MMTSLSPAEQQTLAAALREGEAPLWVGKGTPGAPPRKTGFLARLFRQESAPAPAVLYAITPKRVLALPVQGGEPCEWFLMLGLVQAVNERPGGSGDIVFDFEEVNGQKIPRGLIGIPAVAQVRNLLNDAIDAAYNASPWSV
jgi:hypothetical protein